MVVVVAVGEGMVVAVEAAAAEVAATTVVKMDTSPGSALIRATVDLLMWKVDDLGFASGVGDTSNLGDPFTNLPDDILVMILCLMPIKDAVVTSSVSKKWRFLWRKLTKLNFDGTENINKINRNRRRVFYREHYKFLDQVISVIKSYKHPTLQEFRLRFDLDYRKQGLIDGWLEFAVKKKVEILDLDFSDTDDGNNRIPNHTRFNYNFPSRLSHQKTGRLFKWPSPNVAFVEIVSLKQLFLKNASVREDILKEILTRSPRLEKISIHGSGCLINMRVGGRALNLKHFEIQDCPFVKSIHLSDFGLESFNYMGAPIDLNLSNLPNLRDLFCEGHAGFENNVFKQISSRVSSLQVFSFIVHRPQGMLKLESLPKLPNVKKLTLIIGAHEDESLIDFTSSIVKACPSLESLTIKLLWYTPRNRRKQVIPVFAIYKHEHLKHFEMLGYHGRISDLELVAYVIQNAAVGLKKIVIDTRFQVWGRISAMGYLTKDYQERARSYAKMQLVPMSRPGVNLIIL